jgi:hypothetical protein
MGIGLAEAVGAGLATAGALRAGAGLTLVVLGAAAGRAALVLAGGILPILMLAWVDCWVEPPWVFAAATEGHLAPVANGGMVELGRILMLAQGSSMMGVKLSAIVVNPSSESVLPMLNGVEGRVLPRRSIPT